MRSIGLDVHKRFAQIAILEGKGQPVQRRIGTTTAALRAFARTLRPDDQLVLEATMNTWAIADLLRERGMDAVAHLRALAHQRDATRRLRREVAGRAALVRQRTQVRNRVHAAL